MKIKRVAVAVATCTVLGIAGTSAANAFAAAPTPSLSSKRSNLVDHTEDGRAVFAGLFLNQGRYSEQLATSATAATGIDAREGQKLDSKHVDRLLNSIARNDPNFFADFSRKAHSGNPRLVRQAIGEAHDQLSTVRKQSVDDTGKGTGSCLALAIYAVVVKWKVAYWAPGSGAADPLENDQAVAKLTQRLAAA
ncbi:hypothetical protein EST92_13375 [Streptomyces sp. TM32]|uniref:hypothetical protein n=1 Tax=Streptomyces sp. TM32 TaxID=1652669 RepID=UPI0010139F9A|nr:hypothetical protein [Streptomyces sp. TM32]RXS83679.1 hypothetical protein EST92_13375 [Streptomyces sp. TM32]